MGTIKNTNKISIIKRDKIIKGLKFLDSINNKEHVIDKVIIFGSSVTDDCTEESDIDICLYTNGEISCRNRNFFRIFGGLELEMDDLCDILLYHKLSDGKLKKEIEEKGVIVYEYSMK